MHKRKTFGAVKNSSGKVRKSSLKRNYISFKIIKNQRGDLLTYRTSIELYSHGYPRIPADRMHTDVSGVYWSGELVFNGDISIMVSTEDLYKKNIS